MTTIPSARFSKPNWLELHLKHCSFLTDDKCGTILIGNSIVAGLSRYQNIWNGNFSLNSLNCGIGRDKVQNILWRALNLPAVKSVRNVVILCGTNNLHLNTSEDIADGIIEIGSTFKTFYTNVNVFICGFLPSDCYWSINRVYIKDLNEILKLKCVWFSFSYIDQNTDWTLANGSLNPELFYSDRIHLVEKGNSKLPKSIHKSTEDFYDTGHINRYQSTKTYKIASFVLSNADFPPLSTASKLHSTSINAFSEKHISNSTTVTPFSKTVLPTSKNFVPEDKSVRQLLSNTSLSLNLSRLKGILLIMFYVNLSCHVIPFLLYDQLML